MRLAIHCPECLTGFVVETPDDGLCMIGNHTGIECSDCTSRGFGRTAWMVMAEDRCRYCVGKGVYNGKTCPACHGTGRLVGDDGNVPQLAYNPERSACRAGLGCDVCRNVHCACFGCAKRPECPARAEPRMRCIDDPEPALPPALVEPPPGTLAPLVAVVEYMARDAVAARARRSPWRLLARVLVSLRRVAERFYLLLGRAVRAASSRVPEAPCQSCSFAEDGCDGRGHYEAETDEWVCDGCEIPF
jgi:hypothetical protein